MTAFKLFWTWLGDEINLKRISFLWGVAFVLFGGLSGFTIWFYQEYLEKEGERDGIIAPNGETTRPKEVQLRTSLLLYDYGILRQEAGDLNGAERSFDAALSLIDASDPNQMLHYQTILLSQIHIYREMGEDELFEASSQKYEELFLLD
ncbi:hypothetical protein [Roseospira goensis]|uniref:Tetratricopeptide repeat protein n=1 Tax=Roseospira goensis TaxID=391922 RepID=A0A7W6WM05_9PROT|nr:hypothetical protein [Roseospira goensis]MBB4287926.1 hypothetical protein [Roseospira goensis]